MNKMNWDFIDKCIVINLPERTDRLVAIKSELANVHFPADKLVFLDAIFNENGTLGCSLSHLAAINMAKDAGWDPVLILEDDTVFHPLSEISQPINAFFSALRLRAWDVALLSGQYFKIQKIHDSHQSSSRLFRCLFAYCANSYLVNQTAYSKLISVYENSVTQLQQGLTEDISSLDTLWIPLMEQDPWYCMYPCVAWQGTGYSNITHTHLDRTENYQKSREQLLAYGSTFD